MSGSNGPPFALEGIDHVLLLVDGPPEALRFYCGVLGCDIESALPEFGMVQLRAGAALIDLVDVGTTSGQWARPERAHGRNLDHLCIAIAACDEQALRRTIELKGPPA